MALSKKSVSLSSIVWVCFCLGGVAISLTSGENATTAAPGNVTESNITSSVEPVTTPTISNLTTSETGTTATTTSSNITTETPPGNITTNPSDSTPTGNGTTVTSTAPATSVTSPGPTKPTTSAKPTPPGGDGGRKFDAASFFGGIATAVGVCILIFVAVHCYTRSKKTSYHAM